MEQNPLKKFSLLLSEDCIYKLRNLNHPSIKAINATTNVLSDHKFLILWYRILP